MKYLLGLVIVLFVIALVSVILMTVAIAFGYQGISGEQWAATAILTFILLITGNIVASVC